MTGAGDVEPIGRRWRALVTGPSQHAITLERRWFGLERPDSVLATWSGWHQQQQRLDRYAALDRDDVGLKVRDGRRAGLKVRRCRVDLGDGLPPAERWTRRSARLGDDAGYDASQWLRVAKQRRRRVVDLSRGEPSDTSGRGRPPRGGGLEVVQLWLVDHELTAWTVAVEAWGPDDIAALRQMTSYTGVGWTEVHEWAQLAGSYPRWLRSPIGY